MARSLFDRKVKGLRPRRRKVGDAARLSAATGVLVRDLLDHAEKKLARRGGLNVGTVLDLLTALFAGEDVEVKIYITSASVSSGLEGHLPVWFIGRDPKFEVSVYTAARKATLYVTPF